MLICVRHGESAENQILHNAKEDRAAIVLKQANAPLTPIGIQQAQATAAALSAELSDKQGVVVWTSQLDRSINTAAPLIEALQAKGIEVLVERRADLNEKTELEAGTKQPEKLAAFIERVRPVARRLLEAEWSDCLILVGHSVFISVLTSLLLRGPDTQLQDLEYRNPNCAITRFDWKEQVVLLSQKDISHLPPHLRTGVD